ncbi:heterokaryon incompatibility protein-domain-containing protein [Halenospora varia]|nr:heterokaryon incompatibility protein-domain-containing protein [Halenospora varia]
MSILPKARVLESLGERPEVQDNYSSPYVYPSIEADTEIRVLELHPPTPESPQRLSCGLSTKKLADRPLYEALSYVWGAQELREPLHLATGIISITSNLAAALRELRYQDRSRSLWADAICINQQDDTEKGQQIALMGKIYANTEGVLAWLGAADDATNSAMAIIREIASRSMEFGIDPESPINSATKHRIKSNAKVAFADLHHTLNFQSLNRFFALDWFHRIWIMQEIALPPCISLCCGSVILNWSQFEVAMSVLLVLFRLRSRVGGFGHDFVRCWKIVSLRRSVQNQDSARPRTILELVEAGIGGRCLDDRDRIYGVLGLQTDSREICVKAEYTRRVEDIYQDFAFQHLKNGILSILNLAGMGDDCTAPASHSGETNLPTWVPDWRNNAYQSRYNFLWPTFSAATHLKISIALGDPHVPFLGVKGILIDEVQRDRFSCFPANRPNEDEMRKIMVQFHQICIEIATVPKYKPKLDFLNMGFARALVMDARTSEASDLLGSRKSPSDLKGLWEEYQALGLQDGGSSMTLKGVLGKPGLASPIARIYSQLVHQIGRDRNLFLTKNLHIGLGSIATRAGDIIVAFHGAHTPVVLRTIATEPPSETVHENVRVIPSKKVRLVGPCYFQGFMDNEVSRTKYAKKSEVFIIC